jgi:hypothetical protein
MIKETMYMYLGTNGTICSPVHLEDIYYIRQVRLTASQGKLLTKDGLNLEYRITIPESEIDEWYEVDIPKGQE